MVRTSEEVKRDLDLVDRKFGTIDEILWFNRHGHGPFSAAIQVRANVHPDTHYPEARISIGQHGPEPKEMDFGGVLLTVQQANELVKLIKSAIAAAVKACPSLVTKIDFEDLDG